MVGFVPLFGASTVAGRCSVERIPEFSAAANGSSSTARSWSRASGRWSTPGADNTLILGLVRPDQLRRMLAYMLDEDEFLSPYGVRAVSRYHLEHPLVLHLDGQEYRLDYEPGESTTDLFGGNSNWRGPIWMPVNFLILLALRAVPPLLRRHVPGGMPDRLGQDDERWIRSPMNWPGACRSIFLRDAGGQAAGLRRPRAVQQRPSLARPDSVSRILPRRHGPRLRRQPPNRLDRY